jgi:hypothetical protein
MCSPSRVKLRRSILWLLLTHACGGPPADHVHHPDRRSLSSALRQDPNHPSDPKAYVAWLSTATDCFRNPQRPLNRRHGTALHAPLPPSLFGPEIAGIGWKLSFVPPLFVGPALLANEMSVYDFARGVNFYRELNPLAELRRRSAFSRTRPSSYPRLTRGGFTVRSHTRGHRAGAVRGSLRPEMPSSTVLLGTSESDCRSGPDSGE